MFGLLIRKLRQRGHRRMMFGVVACWLLFNAQLALAAHLCDVPAVAPTSQTLSHQGGAMQHGNMMHAAHVSTLAKAPLCDKHCTPDNAQKTVSPLHLDAMAHDAGTLLAIADDTPMPEENAWLTPPRTGPPAEIVFCRFRE